jgi:hypothetical protein
MPDISFDSLIIVLLVLASLFGRLFKKNKNDEGAPPPPDNPLPPPNPMRRHLNSAMSLTTSGKKTGREGNRNIKDLSKESNRFPKNR